VIDRLSMWWISYALGLVVLGSARYFPFHLVDFLEDSYKLHILRRAGGVYQFRHATLQDHLARRPTHG
jgi:hypothetical protein